MRVSLPTTTPRPTSPAELRLAGLRVTLAPAEDLDTASGDDALSRAAQSLGRHGAEISWLPAGAIRREDPPAIRPDSDWDAMLCRIADAEDFHAAMRVARARRGRPVLGLIGPSVVPTPRLPTLPAEGLTLVVEPISEARLTELLARSRAPRDLDAIARLAEGRWQLTPTEARVLRHILGGKPVHEAAQRLDLSPEAMATYIRILDRKMRRDDHLPPPRALPI